MWIARRSNNGGRHMEETKGYIVKTGRVLHEARYYEVGESVQLGYADAEKLGKLGIIEYKDPSARSTIAIDNETAKTLYVQGTLDLGPKHPANGVAVLMDKEAADKLGALGIVSFVAEESATPV